MTWRDIHMRSKYEVLQEREQVHRREADRLARELAGLDATPCGLTCDGCGETLATEGDFARHFLVPDERFLNLGNCPKDYES